jgi:hypothetical protein
VVPPRKEDAAGNVVLQLKSPWLDETTRIRITPLEFMQRLAALVPRMGLPTRAPPRSPARPPMLARGDQSASKSAPRVDAVTDEPAREQTPRKLIAS